MGKIEIEQLFEVSRPSKGSGGSPDDAMMGFFIIGSIIVGGVVGAVYGGGWGCAAGMVLAFCGVAMLAGALTS